MLNLPGGDAILEAFRHQDSTHRLRGNVCHRRGVDEVGMSLVTRRLVVPWRRVRSFRCMTVGSKKYNLPTEQENSNLIPLRHSTAHVMAMAVQSLYPDGKVTIGPCIQHGYVLIILFSEHLSSTTGSIMISISRRESSLRVI
jgi:hypothetical protein